jgi:hypothetical protein
MKSLQFNLLVWLFAASIAFAQSYPISISNSTIEWKGYKLTSDHYLLLNLTVKIQQKLLMKKYQK